MMAAGVRSMPTFHFYCGGAKVDECRGANIQAVEQRVLQHKGAARYLDEECMASEYKNVSSTSSLSIYILCLSHK